MRPTSAIVSSFVAGWCPTVAVRTGQGRVWWGESWLKPLWTRTMHRLRGCRPISTRGSAEAVSRGAAGAGVVWRRDGLFTTLVLDLL